MDKKHLIKIVEYLLEDTIIDYDNTTIQLIGSDLEYDIEFIHDEFFKMLWNKLEDNYGLNGDEIVYVLGNYLYQINKKIKLSGSINESVENKEIYLDKIVQYIIDDTVIDYDKNLCKLPYLYNPIPIIPPFIIPSPYYYSFLTYCKDIYGLTGEEIIYVWEKYKSIVDDKGSINESVGNNKEIYLDKIVQYIIDDTELDYEQKLVTYPFIPNIPSQWGLSVPLYIVEYGSPFFNEFSKYCNDMYGLSYEESVYVWDHYSTRLIDNKFINESVDSKKTYLDKIVQYIIDDTVIDYEEREIKYPYFSNILLLTPNKQQHLPTYSFRAFSIYCEDMYGLNIEEIQYVWHHYIKNSELF